MFKSAFFFLLVTTFIYAQNLNRYTDSLFNSNQEIANGVYAIAPELNSPYQGESLTHNEELKFHLFSPVDDTLKNRPMLIAIHGGGFVSGNKEHDDMMEFCNIFAQRGYVTATIQYRLGMNMLSSVSSERSVYRGLQDGRAAIRYFKENYETYGIDTNNIFLIGSSAGSFISLHNLFLNEESEKPAGANLIAHFPATTDDGPDLGKLDEINPTLKHGSHPNGVISLWGAIKDTTLIKESDGDIPLLLIHGTADNIVPFDVGSPFSATSLPPTYGSKPISERLATISKKADIYFVSGEGHEFYGVSNGNWSPAPNAYWDTVVTKTANFLWSIHKPSANFNYTNDENKFSFFDISNNAVRWEWDFGDGNISNEQNPEHQYYDLGEYLVTLRVESNINSWDTVSTVVIAPVHVDVNDEGALPIKFELSQNHPNPFNPTTRINFSIPNATQVSIKVFNALGEEITELANRKFTSGNHSVDFDGSNMSSGMYFYRLQADGFSKTMKMVLLK